MSLQKEWEKSILNSTGGSFGQIGQERDCRSVYPVPHCHCGGVLLPVQSPVRSGAAKDSAFKSSLSSDNLCVFIHSISVCAPVQYLCFAFYQSDCLVGGGTNCSV